MNNKQYILKFRDKASLQEWKSGLFKWLSLAMISPETDEKDRENVLYYFELINEFLENIVFNNNFVNPKV